MCKCQHAIQPIWKPTSEGPPPGDKQKCRCVWPCETPWPISRPCLLSRRLIRQVDRTNGRLRRINLVLSGKVSLSPPSSMSLLASGQLEILMMRAKKKKSCRIVCKGKGVFAEMRGICENGRFVASTMQSMQNKWLVIAYRTFIFPRAAAPRRDLRYATELGRPSAACRPGYRVSQKYGRLGLGVVAVVGPRRDQKKIWCFVAVALRGSPVI